MEGHQNQDTPARGETGREDHGKQSELPNKHFFGSRSNDHLWADAKGSGSHEPGGPDSGFGGSGRGVG